MRAVLVVVALIGGCASDRIFDETGFVHSRYGYHIGYASGRRGVWLSGEWRVENYGRSGGEWVRRRAEQYWHEPILDMNGDGIATRLPREYIYDLRLRHVRSNGMIWARSVPLELDLQEVELDVLARNYVENIAGLGFLLARVAPGAVAVEERRYASRVLDQMPMHLDGHEAYGVMLEVASVEQLQLSNASRVENAVIVLSRAPFGWREHRPSGHRDWPVIMIVGYSNSPAEFERGLPDFERLLAAIDLEREVDDE